VRALAWALSGLLLFPLLYLQGRRARRSVPRLPEAAGDAHGATGEGPALRLVVIGESPVAGVGVATYEEALAAQLARALATQRSCRVHWHALGENGADAAGVLARLAPRVEPCDIAVLVLGVNDTTGFTRLSRWRAQLRALVAALRAKCSGTIVLAGVPPMGRFVGLPWPLRAWLGLRASMLDDEVRRLARSPGLVYAPVPPLLEPRHLARDGFHPSAEGCAGWALELARGLPGPP
jgi:lysophospholipase L1-like esterase